MDNTEQPANADAARRPKPLLTVEQQIAHMKEKGITFDLCSEEEAAKHLREKCQFFRIYSYRELFDRREGGARAGQYVNLDFGHLKALSNLDRMLRDALLPMTLDIEHFMKVRLLSAAEDNGEDGFAVLRDYLKSLPRTQLDLVNGELDRRRNDPYVGAAVRKYRTDMPIWVFCEVMPLGMFSGLVKFCADRWNDPELRKIHYLLKNARSVRNFCAHGACSVNGLLRRGASARPPAVLVNELMSAGIPKRLRSKWLRGERMVNACSTLYLYHKVVPEGTARSEREAALKSLFDAVEGCGIPRENAAVAALLFMKRLTVAVGVLN